MRNKLLFSSILLAASVSLSAQQSATITLHADQGKQIIPKEIYGQFAEHLGTCIYGGLWVGENSNIPNIKGYRTDVFNALKDLQVPVLRWPGGCFADEYHWMDGIGPKENRPKMVNTTGAALSKTTVSAHTSSSTFAKCWVANLTSAATWEAEPLRNLPNGWNT